eukprot:2624512-Amphidinium_carterae.1
MLNLRFVWLGERPVLLCQHDQAHLVILRANVHNNLPLITSHEAMGLIQGIRNGTKEKTWGKDEWVHVLGRDLEVYDWELESWTYGGSVWVPPTEAHVSICDAKQNILETPIPKAHTRTNVVEQDFVPKSICLGAYTRRGKGVVAATYERRKLVSSIHVTRLEEGEHLRIHQDTNNEGESYITTVGEYSGEYLWVEDEQGQHVPPEEIVDGRENLRKLRGHLYDLSAGWVVFDPNRHHGVTKVKSGLRVSVTLFTPKGWQTLGSGVLWRLKELGFSPPIEAEAKGGTIHPCKCHEKDDQDCIPEPCEEDLDVEL